MDNDTLKRLIRLFELLEKHYDKLPDDLKKEIQALTK